jgi:hypothetical protein
VTITFIKGENMKSVFLRLCGYLITASLVLMACASKVTQTVEEKIQPNQITGTYKVTNDFVLATYYVENAVTLTDMHGFVVRDLKWELPVDSQTLGFMTFDVTTQPFRETKAGM